MKMLIPSVLLSCLALMGASGCAGPVEARLRSQGAGVGDDRLLMWAPSPAGEALTPHMEQAREMFSAALRDRGFSFAAEAPLSVSLSVSERPADIAVSTGNDAAFSPAKDHRLMQSCQDRILRLRVVMIERTSGEIRYAGDAQEAHCKAGLDDALPRLAKLAVADMDEPRGERRVTTPGRD